MAIIKQVVFKHFIVKSILTKVELINVPFINDGYYKVLPQSVLLAYSGILLELRLFPNKSIKYPKK